MTSIAEASISSHRPEIILRPSQPGFRLLLRPVEGASSDMELKIPSSEATYSELLVLAQNLYQQFGLLAEIAIEN